MTQPLLDPVLPKSREIVLHYIVEARASHTR